MDEEHLLHRPKLDTDQQALKNTIKLHWDARVMMRYHHRHHHHHCHHHHHHHHRRQRQHQQQQQQQQNYDQAQKS